MRRLAFLCAISLHSTALAQTGDSITLIARQHQYDLSRDGAAFLLAEARAADFFMLGELHGENEIPSLLRGLWPGMWQSGYRHIAIETSPWAARQLETGRSDIATLWTQAEADFVRSVRTTDRPVLWGSDIEEAQPERLIAELAAANPANVALRAMKDLTSSGYRRESAPQR